MSRELDRLFDRRRSSSIAVQDAFTDREDEIAAFGRALRAVRGEPVKATLSTPDRTR